MLPQYIHDIYNDLVKRVEDIAAFDPHTDADHAWLSMAQQMCIGDIEILTSTDLPQTMINHIDKMSKSL